MGNRAYNRSSTRNGSVQYVTQMWSPTTYTLISKLTCVYRREEQDGRRGGEKEGEREEKEIGKGEEGERERKGRERGRKREGGERNMEGERGRGEREREREREMPHVHCTVLCHCLSPTL